jgi:hypothetical protein
MAAISKNSGGETVIDLLGSLWDSYHGTGTRKISVHIICISSIDFIETPSWQGIGEILSPIRAMLSTRDSRGTVSMYRIASFTEDCFRDKSCNSGDSQFNIFPINLIDFPIPLGWQLSPISENLIELHSGYADKVNHAPLADITDPVFFPTNVLSAAA